jgi:uncharacterized protein with ParB-like and HNH nuclease domain
MHIKPFDRDIKNILETGFYTIPRFQRPYSWDRENVEDFWADTVSNDEPDYFIGSMVAYKTQAHSEVFFLVDGQQRLTTITLFLSAIRNSLEQNGEHKLASALQKFIEREDLDGESAYVLKTETSYPYLQEYIQKFADPDVAVKSGPEEKTLERAYEFLTQHILQTVASIKENPAYSEKKYGQRLERYLCLCGTKF